ncbi:MAG TPA: hypothetical protein ENJ82_01385 [Bacteroidetes bacterium]|nr:hypothetical protein [Bacteroidota bacterium]
MKKVTFFSLFLVLVLGLSSCTYEEGPFLSVRSKTERVANTWVVGKTIKDGVESSSQDGFKSIAFTNEGNATFIGTVLGVEYTMTGTWKFNDDNSVITVDLKDSTGLITSKQDWTILKLKEKDLWVTFIEQDISNTDVIYEVHFIPAES